VEESNTNINLEQIGGLRVITTQGVQGQRSNKRRVSVKRRGCKARVLKNAGGAVY